MFLTLITISPRYGPGRSAVDYFVWYQPGVQSVLCPDHGALHAMSLLPFFSHFTHETYVQTGFNHNTKFIPHSTTDFGADEYQKTSFDKFSFAIISPVESHFTKDHTIITTPTVWEPRKF
jgi:hypothetical protein